MTLLALAGDVRQRNMSIRSINEHGHELAEYIKLQLVFESRRGDRPLQRAIGDALRSGEDGRRVCEVKIAVKALNRMLNSGVQTACASLDSHPPGTILTRAHPCNKATLLVHMPRSITHANHILKLYVRYYTRFSRFNAFLYANRVHLT
jgi:hypothetical protein